MLPFRGANVVANHGMLGLVIGLVVGGMPPWDPKAGPLLGLFDAILGAVLGILVGLVRQVPDASASQTTEPTKNTTTPTSNSDVVNNQQPQDPASQDRPSDG
jgi:hypothetical protein